MAGLGRAFLAAFAMLLIILTFTYLFGSTVFKSYISLPKDIHSVQKQMADFEQRNAEEHADLHRQIEGLRSTHPKSSKKK